LPEKKGITVYRISLFERFLMDKKIGFLFYVGMILLTFVSMCTTYISLNDSILPEPKVPIPMPNDLLWDCSVLALALSVGIGLMLLALKLAIIDEKKRLSAIGLLGLCLLAFISICFNMDVLYRTADRDFFLRYSSARVKAQYAEFFATTRAALDKRKLEFRRPVAVQEGELEAEIRGLREAPAGYGPIAKDEDYALIQLQKVAEVELEGLVEAYETDKQARALLASSDPQTLAEVEKVQDELRVAAISLAATTSIPLPPPVKLENPLFAVLSNLVDPKAFGLKEGIFVVLAFLLDLGDILGYTLLPNRKKSSSYSGQEPLFEPRLMPRPEPPPPSSPELAFPDLEGPEVIPDRGQPPHDEERAKELFFGEAADSDEFSTAPDEGPPPRAFRFRRRR
jgi:hypothetical protein